MPEAPGQPCARFAQAAAGMQWGDAFAFVMFGGVSAAEDLKDLCVWIERT